MQRIFLSSFVSSCDKQYPSKTWGSSNKIFKKIIVSAWDRDNNFISSDEKMLTDSWGTHLDQLMVFQTFLSTIPKDDHVIVYVNDYLVNLYGNKISVCLDYATSPRGKHLRTKVGTQQFYLALNNKGYINDKTDTDKFTLGFIKEIIEHKHFQNTKIEFVLLYCSKNVDMYLKNKPVDTLQKTNSKLEKHQQLKMNPYKEYITQCIEAFNEVSGSIDSHLEQECANHKSLRSIFDQAKNNRIQQLKQSRKQK